MQAKAKNNHHERAAAQTAGLRYVTDQHPGLRRERNGDGFHYLTPNGRQVKQAGILKRIRSIVIPPAWTDVWICEDAQGHIQATGRDARGRKQYRYHPRWRETRDETKFDRMVAFGRVLPDIRRRVRRDLRAPGLGREKVLAAIVRLMDLSAIRVGNDEYADHNKSYGLTTLQDRHAKISGDTIHLNFCGKSGKSHAISIESPVLARIVKKCQDLPGQELFQWVGDDGKLHDVTSEDVNGYLFGICQRDCTSKDFRTWTGTVGAALALCELKAATSEAKTKSGIARAIEQVAKRLGNTPSVCRKCYVHPAILDYYRDGTLMAALRQGDAAKARNGPSHLRSEESAVLRLLRRKVAANGESLQKKLQKSLRRVKARRLPASAS